MSAEDSTRGLPLVSIGIPTYNRSADLLCALGSALRQDYANIEVVVSDDASTDDTQERLAEVHDPRLRIFRQPANSGITQNFNACLERATGEFFLLLNDDDSLAPTAISTLMRPFIGEAGTQVPTDVGVSWCAARVVDKAGTQLWVSKAGPPIEGTLDFLVGYFEGRYGLRFCGVLLRRLDAIAVGGYKEDYGNCNDVGNWAAVALRHPYVASTNSAVATYMFNPDSYTGSSNGALFEKWSRAVMRDLTAYLNSVGRGDDAARLQRCLGTFIANSRVAVIIQAKGRKDWPAFATSQLIGSWKYFLNLPIARRVLAEAWKLARF